MTRHVGSEGRCFSQARFSCGVCSVLTVTMRLRRTSKDSRWWLLADLFSVHALVWVFGRDRDAELSVDSHLYFWDRYSRLGRIYRSSGRIRKAAQYERRAQDHYDAAGLDGPPYAAAMARPRPGRFVVTNAVAGRSPDDPLDAA